MLKVKHLWIFTTIVVLCEPKMDQNSEELWNWLETQSQPKKLMVTKCDTLTKPTNFEKPFLKYHSDCPKNGTFFRYEGPKNSDFQPHGNGKLVRVLNNFGHCYETFDKVEYVYGNFRNGLLHGKSC